MTNLTGGKVEGAKRINAACFVDGNDDEFVIEFWDFGGSVLRTSYNRRTTESDHWFVPANTWEFDELKRLSAMN